MSYLNIVKEIKQHKISPVYCLYGTETFFMDEIQTHLEKYAVDSKADITTYDLLEISLDEAVIDAETYPFFSDRKLIIIKNAFFLSPKNIKTNIEYDIKRLENYLKQPTEFSTILFIAPYEKLDGRKSITKLIKKTSRFVECNPLKGKQTAEIVKNIAAQHQLELSEDARLFLENELQDNIALMEKEIEKLAIYVGDKRQVTKEIAEKIISPSNDYNALQFVEAVLKKDLAFAVKIYRELEKMKEDPIKLIGLLSYQFRVIYRVKLLKNKGLPLNVIKQQISLHPYVVQLAFERANFFTDQQLAQIMKMLMKTDENVKRGKMEKKIAFEMLLYYLVEQSNKA